MSALAVLSGVVASAGLLLPADAAVNAAHTVFVLKNDSIVEAEGYVPGEPMTVEVRRNGVVVGSIASPASTGGTLIINHDECWDTFTPQILPGDVVRVTSNGGATVETVRVANIHVVEGPVLTGNSFTIRGRVDGPRIPAGQLQVEARTEDPIRFRPLAPGNEDGVIGTVAYDGATGGAFTATFTGLNAQQVQAVPNLAEFFVVHAPAANELTMASEGTGAAGPGCPPSARHAVTDLSRQVINRANRTRNLTVSGVTLNATAVRVRLRDGDGTLVERPANLTGTGAAQTWRATLTPFQMRNLNGTIRVAGRYTSGAATLNGATMALQKDLVNPNPPRASLRPGVYKRRQFITLDAGPAARIRWTLGRRQAAPTARRGNLYRGQQIAITSTQTLKMRAVDRAGNVSRLVTKRYVIRR
jgi:hypothetical protein